MKYSTLKTVIFASYWGSPLVQFSKFKKFLWVCWFLCKNLSNFVSLPWKFHNPYCHTWHPWVCIRSVCWKWNLKQIEAIPPSVHLQLLIPLILPKQRQIMCCSNFYGSDVNILKSKQGLCNSSLSHKSLPSLEFHQTCFEHQLQLHFPKQTLQFPSCHVLMHSANYQNYNSKPYAQKIHYKCVCEYFL